MNMNASSAANITHDMRLKLRKAETVTVFLQPRRAELVVRLISSSSSSNSNCRQPELQLPVNHFCL
jgi:hypothetical protein